MPIRPCNDIMGRHLAAWFYPKNERMPDFSLDQLMNSNTIEKVKANYPDDDMPEWLINYVEERDKRSAEYDTGRENKMYHADILVIYNRCKREFFAMDMISEFGITAVDLGMEDWQLPEYLDGKFILDEARLNALILASECKTREDFLYIYAKVYDVQKSVKLGNFKAIPTTWQRSLSLGDWKDGHLEELIDNKCEKKWIGKNAEATSKVAKAEARAEEIRQSIKKASKVVIKSPTKEPAVPEKIETRGRKSLSPLGKTKIVGTILPKKLVDMMRAEAEKKGITLNKFVRTVIEEEARNASREA